MELKYLVTYFLLLPPTLCIPWICSEIGCSEGSSAYGLTKKGVEEYPGLNEIKFTNKTVPVGGGKLECAIICDMEDCPYFVIDEGK